MTSNLNNNFRLAAALALVLVASVAFADITLVPTLSDTITAGRQTLTLVAENDADDTVATYAFSIVLADNARFAGSATAGDFGMAPTVNAIDNEVRVSGYNAGSTFTAGNLFTIDIIIDDNAGQQVVAIADYKQHALVNAGFATIAHTFATVDTDLGTNEEPTAVPTEEPTAEPTAEPTPQLVIDTDLNDDCHTDIIDVAAVVDAFDTITSDADTNGDAQVDAADLENTINALGTVHGDCAGTATADGEPVFLYNYQTVPGADGLVEVIVETLEPATVRGYELTLTYDADALQLVDGIVATALDIDADNSALQGLNETDGTLHAVALRTDGANVEADTVIGHFFFRYSGEGNAEVELAGAKMLDANGDLLPVAVN